MTERPRIVCQSDAALDVSEFRRVLVESGLGATRPVDDAVRLATMVAQANLMLTARLHAADGPLVGVARCMTDFSWNCFVSELAVCASAQGLGVGQALLAEARHQLGPAVSIVLLSVPTAVSFYERIGMQRVPDAFVFRREG